MEELAKLLGIGTPLLYAGAVYGLFHWIDTNASAEARAAIAGTLRVKEYNEYDDKRVAAALVEVFDGLYSRPLLS